MRSRVRPGGRAIGSAPGGILFVDDAEPDEVDESDVGTCRAVNGFKFNSFGGSPGRPKSNQIK